MAYIRTLSSDRLGRFNLAVLVLAFLIAIIGSIVAILIPAILVPVACTCVAGISLLTTVAVIRIGLLLTELSLDQSVARRVLLGEISAEISSMFFLANRIGEVFIPISGWTMRFTNVLELERLIVLQSPKVVIEFGSGLSTIVMAESLKRLGGGSLVSVDSCEDWRDVTNSELERRGLDSIAKVYHAPIVQSGERGRWYDFDPSSYLNGSSIDLMVVDGPPTHGRDSASRSSALDACISSLSKDATIVLDDVDRPSEQAVLKNWLDCLPRASTRIVGAISRMAIISLRNERH